MYKISFKFLFCAMFLLVALPTTTTAQAPKKKITLDDIWLKYAFYPQYADDFRWMQDDRYYSLLDAPKGGSPVITKYSITDNKPVSTILDLASVNTPELKTVDSYEFSENERQILLKTQTEQIYRHSSKEVCYVWDTEKSKLYSIFGGKKISNAVFSPDGTKIAFVAENDLFTYDFATGKETAVTNDGVENHVINGATDWVYEEEFSFAPAFFWSPDSRYIAYYRFDESEVKEFSMDMFTGLYPTQYKFKYPKAGEKNSVVDIFTVDVGSGKIVQADLGKEKDIYIPRIKWTKAEGKLAIMRMNRLQNEVVLLLADAVSGKTSTILTEKNNTYIEITDDKWMFLKNSSDFLWTSEENGYNHIYRYGLDGKLVAQLTSGDYEVASIAGIDEKNDKLYFLSTEVSALERHLYCISLKGGKKKRMTEATGNHDITFSSACSYFVDSYSSMSELQKTELRSTEDGKVMKTLVDNKVLAERVKEYQLGTAEFFKFKTSEKVELNGWMIKPADFDKNKKYPVLMYVYGGPGHQTVKNEWGLGARGFDFMWYNMLANQGYIVVSVDGRGTGGRGEKFRKSTYANLGKYELDDQVEAAKYLQGLSYIDGKRIGIWGWSFGGYLTSLCMTKGNGVFKMGIAVAPVTNWRFYDTIYTERYLQTPQLNASGYDDNSPINFAQKLQGSYLLIHGSADDNVHYQNTMEWTTALVNANRPFDMMVYPNKNHSIAGGKTRYHLYQKMTGYIMANL
ncbi:MAG: S9 family peptidase [Bacteroidia bacterium]